VVVIIFHREEESERVLERSIRKIVLLRETEGRFKLKTNKQ